MGIGASAGGLEALEELFAPMPVDTGMAFVVVTHQHPGHTSLLPEILGKTTRLPVVEARDAQRLQPNHVYLSPPGGTLAVLHGTLHRMEQDAKRSPHLPIDSFLRSLAADQKEKAICIILSGTGADGTLGLKAIKGESGMAMVQQVESAKYAGMPSSAIATGLADFVVPAAEMAPHLVAYARGPYLSAARAEEAPGDFPESMQKIFVLLRSRTGHDFSAYKPNTIRRRIERRMNLHQAHSPAQYVRFLQGNPHELDILFKELLISVTNFFRDPEAFESLAENALPELIASRPVGYTFRIWVPGCATGEEVYSLAIVLRECIERAKRPCDVQVFGTDLDGDAIETARLAQYPEGICSDVSAQRLERFFLQKDNQYRIRKDIREMAIFAVQNAIKDPPFTKLDVVSCRNLLIYLNADLQRRLLPIFHYSLKPGGLLFLGSSETIGNCTDLFEVVDKKWKIFRRKETAPAVHPILQFPAPATAIEVERRPSPVLRTPREPDIAKTVEKLLIARFAPPSVVISDRGDVVFIHGRTGLYLEPASGQPRLNVLDMAREGLRLELAAAIREATLRDHEVIRDGLRVRTNGDFTVIDLAVSKLHDPESLRGLLLVSFRPSPPEREKTTAQGRSRTRKADEPRVEQLERELQCTKESLQTTIEELEAANEELNSSNEELQSTNEEMQSTSEEMETSREEMQSLNEELTTVNAELQSKVEDLSRSRDDMQNLLNSTDVATIFLDSDLRIKRYTDRARSLVSLIPGDIDRPLGDLVSKLAYGRLVADCQEVLRSLVFKVQEVQSNDGHWYLMRIMPYRTAENVINGVVLTFVDINPVKSAEKSLLRMSKAFLEGPEPMLLLDLEGRLADANSEALRAYGWERDELLQRPFATIVEPVGRDAAVAAVRRCAAGEVIRNLACNCLTRAGTPVPAAITFKLLTDHRGEADAICLLMKHA